MFEEFEKINEWYDSCGYLREITIDYLIKSIQSACLQYEGYYPDHQARKVFNDMLGLRTLCKNNIGQFMKQAYDNGKISNEADFKEVLEDVLLDSKEV